MYHNRYKFSEIPTMTTKHNLGQYFTTHNKLKEKVFEFILNSPTNILEPSIGQGDLITYITDKIPNITFDMYEIDTKIKLLITVEPEWNSLSKKWKKSFYASKEMLDELKIDIIFFKESELY